MPAAPIILVPGFWLGAWAWDEVAAPLRAEGHDVTALTLPGLEPADTDRGAIRLEEHVEAMCDAVRAAAAPPVLAVHSGAGVPGYAVTDRIPDRLGHVVYVDSFPEVGPIDPDFAGDEKPLPSWGDLGENLDGISEEQLATFRQRAVPQPGAALRDRLELRDERRLDVPTTVLCTAWPSAEFKKAIEAGQPWLAALGSLRNVTWVDLPTSHWPMWSRPQETARVLADAATRAGS
jgi:pimeloyl-ACP methyl ester carboxylesterase